MKRSKTAGKKSASQVVRKTTKAIVKKKVASRKASKPAKKTAPRAAVKTTRAVQPIVGIHLDMKYLMPNKKYLLQWVQELPRLGINTLLLEYEDKFPFTKHPFIKAEGCFSPAELKKLLATARGAGLRIIPLVQTLGHLEFALEHPQLAHLREREDITNMICPSNPEAVQLVRDLLDQVLAAHKDDEYFHMGADETWWLGTCEKCAKRIEGRDKADLWAEHLTPLIQYVQSKGKKVMLWDDTFWPNPERTKTTVLPKDVILVSWNYGATQFDPAKRHRTDVYREAGFTVLGAPCLNWGVLTPMHDHNLKNTRYWVQQIKHSKLQGMINTAWACFHTALPTQLPYIAATGAMMAGNEQAGDDAWMARYLSDYFDVDAAAIPQALRDLGTNWEQQVVPDLGRPITPIVYGYMDMVAHFKGAQDERHKRGGYPRDWSQNDFVALYRRKIELLKNLPDQSVLSQKLDQLLPIYQSAQTQLHLLAEKAGQNREHADMLAVLADLKVIHVRILNYLLRGLGDLKNITDDHGRIKNRLQKAITPYFEKVAVQRAMQMWFEPADAYLTRLLAEKKK